MSITISVQISLFGALRQYSADPTITLQCQAQANIAQVRQAIQSYAQAHWPAASFALIQVSALASEHAVLREDQAIPENHQLALLPPVSGG